MKADRKRLIELLREACAFWGVTLIAPYWVEGEGPAAVWPGLIPDWGGARGTVVDVLAGEGHAFSELQDGLGCALIGLQDLARDPVAYLADRLGEWGYCGDPSDVPDALRYHFSQQPRSPVAPAAMTLTDLKPGLEHSVTIEVDPGLTVPHLPRTLPGMANMPSVFATAYMVAFVEATAIEAITPYLAADQRTVGTSVNMSHTAATPVGFKVTATVHLVAVEGKKLTFKVEARDEKEVIGQGTHERFVIDLPKFNARLEAKKGGA